VPKRLAYTSPGWGVGEVWLEADRLLWHELPRPAASQNADRHPLLERFVRFFSGKPDDFLDVELDLEDTTPFQQAVVAAMRRIPYGQTASYADVAELAGYPRAARAVGNICAHNRYGLVVPCHRVTASDGIGSYGSLGVDYKRRLLELEGAAL
jgi:methylated-DNA-[protein]-cysteine S-methyltransferase